MIFAEFFIKNSAYVGFKFKGHAGYDDFGNDIVCASVSSAVQLTANTITEFFGIDAALMIDSSSDVNLPKKPV